MNDINISEWGYEYLVQLLEEKTKELQEYERNYYKKREEIKSKYNGFAQEFWLDMLRIKPEHQNFVLQQNNIKKLYFKLNEKKIRRSNSHQNFKEKLDLVRAIPIKNYCENYCNKITIKGNTLRCISPFSNEKTPSFNVDLENNLFYCFSTSQGGDLIKLVQLHHNLNFKETVQFLYENFR